MARAPDQLHVDPGEGPSVALFWRLFIPNACVLGVACAVLWVEPANGRVVALAGGLAVMLAVNLVLMRRAFAPLMRLAALMDRVDPLAPGHRVPISGPESEVTALARAFNAMLDRIESERRESAQRAAAAEEAERRHLAAELHDEIGQTLTALVLQIDRATARGASPAELEAARATAEAALDDVRRLARRLRPEVLDELGLVAALTDLCNRISRTTGLLIHRSFAADLPPLSADEQLAVYRIAQESLTNVIRHARARQASVALTAGRDRVELSISDDGVGFTRGDTERGGGIRGMRERAVQIGAELTWLSRRPNGTEITLRVPVAVTAPAASQASGPEPT
jgi:two-component system, NarL family, sensor histidine kinase UhpB